MKTLNNKKDLFADRVIDDEEEKWLCSKIQGDGQIDDVEKHYWLI